MLLQRNALVDTNKNKKISLKDSLKPAFEYDGTVGFLSILTYQMNQQLPQEIKFPAPSPPPPPQEIKQKPQVPRFRLMIESVYGSSAGSPKILPKKTAMSPQPLSKSQPKSERKIYKNLNLFKSKLLSQNSFQEERNQNNISSIILSKEKQLIKLYTPQHNLKKIKNILEIKPKIREDDVYGLQSLLKQDRTKDKIKYLYKKDDDNKISLSVEKTLNFPIPIYDVNFKEKYEF